MNKSQKSKKSIKSISFSEILKFLKKSRLKIAALIFALLTLGSTMTSAVPTLAALTVGNTYTIESKHLNAYYSTGNWTTANNKTHNNSGQVALYNLKSTGEPLYCIQIYESTDGTSATTKSVDSTDLWNKELTPIAQAIITRTSIYGYDGTSANAYGYSATNAQLATQVIMWEAETGARTNYNTGCTSWAKSIFNNYPDALKCYNKILDAMRTHAQIPTFSSKTVTLKNTGSSSSGYVEITNTNSNCKLSDFNISDLTGNKIYRTLNGDNKLRIWTSDLNAKTVTMTFTKKGTNVGSALALTGSDQTKLYGKVEDPVKTSITVKVQAGSGKVKVKKADPTTNANISGAKLEVREYLGSAGNYGNAKPLTYNASTGYYESGTLYYNDTNNGIFKIVETSAPEGYLITNKYASFSGDIYKEGSAGTFRLADNKVGQELKITLKEDPVTANVKFQKFWSDTDENGNLVHDDGSWVGSPTILDNQTILDSLNLEVRQYNKDTNKFDPTGIPLTFDKETKYFEAKGLTYTSKNQGWFKIYENYNGQAVPIGVVADTSQMIMKWNKDNGYEVNSYGAFRIQIDENGKPINGKTFYLYYTDPVQYGSLKVIKTAEDGILAGHKFRFYGTSDLGEKIDMTRTTDKNGHALFEKVYTGNYVVEEIETGIQYVVPPAQNVNIVWNETSEANFNNLLTRGSVIGHKIDRETKAAIKGAVFGLFKADETAFTKETALQTDKSDSKGEFRFNELKKGNYLIKELEPALGYLPNNEIYAVKINGGNEIVEITVENDKIPEIATSALVNENKDAFSSETITLKDTVDYKHLIPGKEYVVKGALMDKKTGAAFKVNGKPVAAEATIKPKTANGSTAVSFTIPANSITENTDLVVFEELYKDGNQIARHADLKDKNQTVTIHAPKSRTVATINGEKDIFSKEAFTIKDLISYSDLVPGREYTAKGVLMNKATNSPLLINGKEVRSDVTFTPKTADGEITVSFKIAANAITAKTDIVVFEELYFGSVQIANHKDINDKNQTVTVHTPDIGTTATINNEKDAFSAEKVVIKDVVTYRDLIPGKEYTIKGILMNKTAGEPFLVNKKNVTSEVKFTADKANGSAVVTFEFDASVVKEKTELVVFEELYKDKIQLAVHADIHDENQTVSVHEPKITTTATVNKEKSIFAAETFNLNDTVEYSDLVPGREYRLVGMLMNKATNSPLLINGKEIKSEITFKPEASDGKVTNTFSFDSNAITENTDVVVFEELYYGSVQIANHKDIEDIGQTVTILRPAISTVATVNDEKDVFAAEEKITISDVVSYVDLIPGKKYTLKGALMNKATNKPFAVNDEPVVAETTFTAKEANGSTVVTFKFDASAISETTDLVVFEELYKGDTLIVTHSDIHDKNQTITVHTPEIGTTATIENEKDAFSAETFTVEDVVTYSDLIPGKEYTIKGVLMNKATGKPFIVNDEPVASEITFTAEKASGSAVVSFEFDASIITEKTELVAFEELYKEDIQLAVHADLEDENQTVTVHAPAIRTTATVNEEKSIFAAEEFTVEDVVAYSDLVPGREYKLVGTLMNKTTGTPLIINDESVISEVLFTPEEADGTITASFSFDRDYITENTDLVVFEELYYRDVEITSHKDIEDIGQTVTVLRPAISTVAAVNDEKDVFAAEKTITLSDTVSYVDLIPGKEYTIKGILMNKATNEPFVIQDEPVTAETVFTPEEASGEVLVSFEFDASVITETTDLVAFEKLYKGETLITAHEDINDSDQTITIHTPNIGTMATVNGKKEAFADGKLTLEDIVAYTDLIPGKEYTISGVLMNKATGKSFEVDSKPVISSAVFIPEEAEGTAAVAFEFDSKGITKETELVAFEEIYKDDMKLAVHSDINDEGQTVKIKIPEIPDTGDAGLNKGIVIGTVICGAALLFFFIFYLRKKNREEKN